MPDLSLDFGLLIAYFIPGFIALLGATYWLGSVRGMLEDIDKHEHRVTSTLTVASLSIVLGMLISILRFFAIDQTFHKPIILPDCISSLFFTYPNEHFLQYPQHKGFKREDPIYSLYVDEGRLNALLLAEKSDKRPYQFYGNTLMAIAIFFIAWATGRQEGEGTGKQSGEQEREKHHEALKKNQEELETHWGELKKKQEELNKYQTRQLNKRQREESSRRQEELKKEQEELETRQEKLDKEQEELEKHRKELEKHKKEETKKRLKRGFTALAAILLATAILYPACRLSCYRYVTAVWQLNKLPPTSTPSNK